MSIGRLIPGRGGTGLCAPVPAPGIDGDTADILIRVAREDRAKLRRHAHNPDTLQTTIIRFRGAGRDRAERAA